MEISKFSVGDKICDPIDWESLKFDITSSGVVLTLKVQEPSSQDKNDIETGAVRVKAISIDGIVFFLVKFGANPWLDVPYKKISGQDKICHVEDGAGLSLHIMLIDAATGVLVAQRLIGLNTQFVRDLVSMVEQQPAFADWDEYFGEIERIYTQYETEDMVQIDGIED